MLLGFVGWLLAFTTPSSCEPCRLPQVVFATGTLKPEPQAVCYTLSSVGASGFLREEVV